MATRRVAKKEVKAQELPALHSNVDATLQATIVDHLKKNHRVAAIQAFRLATGDNLDVATNTLLAWWNTVQSDMIDTSTYPEACCFNCIGCCGRKAALIADHGPKLYDMVRNIPVGSEECSSRFISEKQLREGMKRPMITFEDYDGYRHTITVDGIIIGYQNQRDRTDKRTIHTAATVRDKFIKDVCDFFTSRGSLRAIVESNMSLMINKVEPVEGETWEAYMARIAASAKERRLAVVKRVEELSDADVITALQEHFKKKGLSEQMKAYKTFDVFYQTFYPDTEPRDLLFNIEREESGT